MSSNRSQFVLTPGNVREEENKGKDNQFRYQIQNNLSKENQQTQTIIAESSPIPDTTLHSDRTSRIDQPELHSNDHSNNTQNEEVVNIFDKTTFTKQNSSIFPILQHAHNLTSSEHQIKDDTGLPLAIYDNLKQKTIIPTSEKPHNSVRTKKWIWKMINHQKILSHIFFHHASHVYLTRVFKKQLCIVETPRLILKMLYYFKREILLLIAR